MGCGASKTFPGGRPTVAELRKQYGPVAQDGTNAADPDAAAPGTKFLRSGASLKKVIETNAVLVVVRVRPRNERQPTRCTRMSKPLHGYFPGAGDA